LIWCYKILFGVVDMPVADLSLVMLNAHVVTVLNCLKGVATLVRDPVSSVSV